MDGPNEMIDDVFYGDCVSVSRPSSVSTHPDFGFELMDTAFFADAAFLTLMVFMRAAELSVDPGVRMIFPDDVITPCKTGLPACPPAPAITIPVGVFAGVIIEDSLMFDSSPVKVGLIVSLQTIGH